MDAEKILLKIQDDLVIIREKVARLEENMREHMKRSATNELAVEELKDQITPVLVKFNMFAKILLLIMSSGIAWKIVQMFLL